MISLKHSIDLLEKNETLVRALCDVYAGVLTALEEAAEGLSGESAEHFRERLKTVRQSIDLQVDPQYARHTGGQVRKEIDAFAHCVNERRSQKEWEYKQIIQIVAEAGAMMVQSGVSESEELKQFTTQVDSVSRLEDISELRKQLASRVTELRQMADRIQERGRAKAQELETKIQRVQEKLTIAETMAQTDPLTGLGNRRMAERMMQNAVESGEPFSLIAIDLNGFKKINDRYGHRQGDQLLKTVGQQLQRSVRDSDPVCRWGGDEFVVLLRNTPLPEAEKRAVQMQADAFGEFVLDAANHGVRVNISASTGIVEHRAGETLGDVFERADQILYKNKRTCRAAN